MSKNFKTENFFSDKPSIKIVSHINDEHFIQGKEYEAFSFNGSLLTILDENGQRCRIGLDDRDFTITF